MELGISYGFLAPSIKEQLKEQGFTLSKNRDKKQRTKCETVQKARMDSFNLLMSGFLTEGELHKVNKRMQKYIVKHLRTLKAEDTKQQPKKLTEEEK